MSHEILQSWRREGRSQHFFCVSRSLQTKEIFEQWQIKDFPEVSVPTPEKGASTCYSERFAKNSIKMKEIGPRKGCAHLDPPMFSLVPKKMRHVFLSMRQLLLDGYVTASFLRNKRSCFVGH